MKVRDWHLPPGEKHLVPYIKRDNGYQQPERDHALSYVREFYVAVDIGAHVGLWAKELCERFETVYAFEPIREHANALKLNVPSPNLYVYEVGLGKEISVAGFEVPKGSSGGTHINLKGTSHPIRTLDSYPFRRIDFMKIDVEGHELDILVGGRETLLLHKPVINLEKKPHKHMSVPPEAAGDYLDSLGAKLLGTFKSELVYGW